MGEILAIGIIGVIGLFFLVKMFVIGTLFLSIFVDVLDDWF